MIPKSGETCKWEIKKSSFGESDYHKTSCNEEHTITETGIEGGYDYCPYCGKSIEWIGEEQKDDN